jgi:hypothetical protein
LALMMACVLVFLAGFHHLIREARADYEWVGTLVFGTGLVLVAVTLVADSTEGGTAINTVAGNADPRAIRALSEGYLLKLFSIGSILRRASRPSSLQ